MHFFGEKPHLLSPGCLKGGGVICHFLMSFYLITFQNKCPVLIYPGAAARLDVDEAEKLIQGGCLEGVLLNKHMAKKRMT